MNSYNLLHRGKYRSHQQWWYWEVYLPSDHWQKRRVQHLELRGYTCEQCGGKAQDVHHVKYRPFGEMPWDLMAVCRPCHEKMHNKSPKKMGAIEADLEKWLK